MGGNSCHGIKKSKYILVLIFSFSPFISWGQSLIFEIDLADSMSDRMVTFDLNGHYFWTVSSLKSTGHGYLYIKIKAFKIDEHTILMSIKNQIPTLNDGAAQNRNERFQRSELIFLKRLIKAYKKRFEIGITENGMRHKVRLNVRKELYFLLGYLEEENGYYGYALGYSLGYE